MTRHRPTPSTTRGSRSPAGQLCQFPSPSTPKRPQHPRPQGPLRVSCDSLSPCQRGVQAHCPPEDLEKRQCLVRPVRPPPHTSHPPFLRCDPLGAPHVPCKGPTSHSESDVAVLVTTVPLQNLKHVHQRAGSEPSDCKPCRAHSW